MATGRNDITATIFLAIVGVPVLFLSLLFVPFVIYGNNRKVETRRAEMEARSRELGLTFSGEKDEASTRNLVFLSHLESGRDRYTLNNCRGRYKGYDVEIFDYHYKGPEMWWWAPSWHEQRYHSFIVLKLEEHFPELLLNVGKKGPFKRVADAFGSADINFESHEFSERFDVRCKNKKFAYDFCHARMIEYLLGKPTIPVELENNVIAVGFRTLVPVSAIEEHVDHLANIRQLMPDYLFDAQEKLA